MTVQKKKTPNKVKPTVIGRPTDFHQELADEICDLLSEGMSMRKVCLIPGMPDKRTVFRWLREKEDFSHQYARAKEESVNAQQEELEEIGEESIRESKLVDPKAASAVVSAYKLKADNMKWVMSKMKPKKYGDKLDHTTDGKPINVSIISYGGNDNPTP